MTTGRINQVAIHDNLPLVQPLQLRSPLILGLEIRAVGKPLQLRSPLPCTRWCKQQKATFGERRIPSKTSDSEEHPTWFSSLVGMLQVAVIAPVAEARWPRKPMHPKPLVSPAFIRGNVQH